MGILQGTALSSIVNMDSLSESPVLVVLSSTVSSSLMDEGKVNFPDLSKTVDTLPHSIVRDCPKVEATLDGELSEAQSSCE